jgi:hypothetical protein
LILELRIASKHGNPDNYKGKKNKRDTDKMRKKGGEREKEGNKKR